MCLALADHRPAHLTRVHQALTSLPEDDQRRLGVIADWKTARTSSPTGRPSGPSAWSRTPSARTSPTGCPPAAAAASAMTCWRHPSRAQFKDASTSLAVDWTDLESFSRPPPAAPATAPTPKPPGDTARTTCPARTDELFFGYYLSAAIMMREENGPAVPELARRMTVCSCRHDPVRALVPVLTAMPAAGIPLGDILADCRARSPAGAGNGRS
jgi:hypothetical protein